MNSVSDSLKWVVAIAAMVALGLASVYAQDSKLSRGDKSAPFSAGGAPEERRP